jgi:hypothetical protein
VICSYGLEHGSLIACRACARARYGHDVPDDVLIEDEVDRRCEQLPTGDR